MAKWGLLFVLVGCGMADGMSKIYQELGTDTFEELFGYSVACGKGRPTNSEYIARIADKVRLDIKEMIKEVHSPDECYEVYTRLVNDKNFPTLVQFDWSEV